jgi:hypothetical protein
MNTAIVRSLSIEVVGLMMPHKNHINASGRRPNARDTKVRTEM